MKRGSLRFDEAFLAEHAAKRSRWTTGGNVSFDVPVRQPSTVVNPLRSKPGAPASGANPSTRSAHAAVTSLATAAQPGTLYAVVAWCKAAGLPVPVPEYQFHPGRRWRFDYAWPLHKLALEVEGGIWTEGRHTRGAGALADLEKYSEAAILGWRIIYATPGDLQSLGFDRVRRALACLS